MTKTITPASLEDLLSLFEETLAPADVLSAKAMSEASRSITSERLRLNMNQKDFAEYIHVKQSQVSRWESGQYNFSIHKLAEIASALDMDLTIRLRKKCEIQYTFHNVRSFSNDDKHCAYIYNVIGDSTNYDSNSYLQEHRLFKQSKKQELCNSQHSSFFNFKAAHGNG